MKAIPAVVNVILAFLVVICSFFHPGEHNGKTMENEKVKVKEAVQAWRCADAQEKHGVADARRHSTVSQ